MRSKEALQKAIETSKLFPGPIFVVRGTKNYFVISERRYVERGLDQKVMAIYEEGKKVA